MRIYLYGAPASGKTTLGKRLARALRLKFTDLDAEIERAAKKTIPQIFVAEGEKGFRERESAALAAAKGEVVALGGGTLLRKSNRAFCEKTGVVLCLETPPEEELDSRLRKGTRPLGDQSRARRAHYASFPHRIAASFELPGSLVLVGSNYAERLIEGYPRFKDLKPKSLRTVQALWRAFARMNLSRADRVVSLGGGTTSDLVGFAASTWMRGIDWISVPTTLLAMVDASIGGKTGVDLPEGKNLIGTFHPPRIVLVDTDYLKTLPEKILRQGRAEMIKHEILGLEGLGGLGGLGGLDGSAIARNLSVKVEIVRKDPYDRKGKRLLLNCGHTIGHALEAASRYRISHGECVAIGCVEEARLAVRLGLAPSAWPDELAKRVRAAKLPTSLPSSWIFEKLLPFMKRDKKHHNSAVTFALPCGWGDVRPVTICL